VATPPASRVVGDLTFRDIAAHLGGTSILCLPLGAIEQHGPHLPLDTDVRVAEALTRRIVARWGDMYDLWQLPTVPIGLSREHDWAPGTMALSIHAFTALLRDIAGAIVRGLPTRNLAIVNGHGGNRGLLEQLLHELAGDFGINACVLHPFDLARVDDASCGFDVHGGKSETSVMLAIAPEAVRRDLIAAPGPAVDQDAVDALIFDRGTTWPWRSDDPRLSHDGAMGDARGASAEFGDVIIASVVAASGAVFARLLENQRRRTPL
jgi:creatinine amidohydrolase/Fe(II)-dependent formamide hydrolase-like protein